MMRIQNTTFFVLLLAVAGCATEVADDPAPREATLENRLLGTGESFAVEQEEGTVAFRAQVRNPDGRDPHMLDLEVGVIAGTVNVRHDVAGNLVIDAIDIELDDVRIGADALPPAGLALTDVRVTLADPVIEAAQWTTDRRAVTASVQGDLLVDWSFSNGDYERLPLAQQTLRGISVTVTVVETADGDLDLTLEGVASGEFLAWTEVVKLSDLSFTMSGVPAVR